MFWDVYGEQGLPIRATVEDMGSLLMSRMLGLNETQSGVMNILFRVARDQGLALDDLKDLKAMLVYIGEHAREYTLNYGNVSMNSIGATTPSDAFSATVSTVAFKTCSSESVCVSRPTSMAICLRPASSPSVSSAFTTLVASFARHLAAKHCQHMIELAAKYAHGESR